MGALVPHPRILECKYDMFVYDLGYVGGSGAFLSPILAAHNKYKRWRLTHGSQRGRGTDVWGWGA